MRVNDHKTSLCKGAYTMTLFKYKTPTQCQKSTHIYQHLTICIIISILSACQSSFHVPARSTDNFPKTWSERVRVIQKVNSNQVSVPSKEQVSPHNNPDEIPPPKFTGESQRVAVLELLNRAPTLVSKDEVSYLTNELRTVASFLPVSKYLVLTQESLEVLIDPSTTLEECVGSCAVETGRLVGARWILTGEVVRFGQSLRVSLKVHDTKSGQFLKGASIKGKSVEDLESDLQLQALTLIKEISPRWGQWLDQRVPNNIEKQLEILKTKTRTISPKSR